MSEDDADKLAVEDLTAQVKNQRGPIATIIRARRDQLKAEISAERAFKRGITATQKRVINNVMIAADNPEVLAALLRPNADLTAFLLESGLRDALSEFIESTDEITLAMKRGFDAVGVEAFENQGQLDFLQSMTATAIFEDIIAPDFKRSIRSALTGIVQDIPRDIVKSNLQSQLERSTGRQLTEVKTQISEYGRSITATAAAAADLDLYLYTGPRDGETRPFCRALINLVVDESQMRKLDNGQGRPVKTSCGGYNCRHSWSPVTAGFVEAADLKRASDSDISKANGRAKR